MKEQILVIVDHDLVRKALRERLELAFPAYQILETDNSFDALSLAIRQPLCITIIDLGWAAAKVWFEVVRQIKSVQPAA